MDKVKVEKDKGVYPWKQEPMTKMTGVNTTG